jgi:hypothetical protein
MAVTQRWPLPANLTPTGTRCLQVTIPDDDDYERLVLAAVNALSYWMVWQRDDGNSGAIVANQFKKLMKTWTDCAGNPVPVPTGTGVDLDMSDELAEVVKIDGKCVFRFRCCVDDDWTYVATKDDLIINQPGTGNQPAPGGGTADYCGVLNANGVMVVPIPVNTGDKIEIVSVTGYGNDGVETIQRCAAGDAFYIDCTGAGQITGVSGDPITAAPHMSLIVGYASSYDQLYPGGSVIVRSGIVAEQLAILVNTAASGLRNGTYNICVRITNNSAAPVTTWCRMFDFTTTAYNTLVSDPINTWISGEGWIHPLSTGDQSFNLFLGSDLTLTDYEFSVANLSDGTADSGFVHDDNTLTNPGFTITTVGIVTSGVSHAGTFVHVKQVRLNYRGGGVSPDGALQFIKVKGIGTPPAPGIGVPC